MKRHALILSLFGLVLFPVTAFGTIISDNNVFTAGVGGYPVYRIPGLITAADGSIITFIEGRPNSSDPGGAGDIDLLARRSTDGGATRGTMTTIHKETNFDFSDPVPILASNGTLHMVYERWPTDAGLFGVPAGTGSNSGNHFYTSSTDHGVSWSAPVNITTQIKEPTWKGMVTGPGSGIELKWQTDPARNGRLVTAAHVDNTANLVVYSDNSGATWQHGGFTSGAAGNEAEIVELVNGDLLLNSRQTSGDFRRQFISSDGGATWGANFGGDINITTVDCSLIRYSAKREGAVFNRLLFSGPRGSDRNNMAVWSSYDEGTTWINPVLLASGSAAYSVLTKLQDGTIGLVYEVDHSTIRYLNFGLDHLEGPVHHKGLIAYDGMANTLSSGSNGGAGWASAWRNGVDLSSSWENIDHRTGDLSFTGFQFDNNDGYHARLNGDPGGLFDLGRGPARMSRRFAETIDMNTNGTYFLSALIQKSADDGGSEYLDFDLFNEAGDSQFAFGIGSQMSLVAAGLGDTVATASGTLSLGDTYFLVMKLVTMDDSAGGNFDQIFLKLFADGDAIALDEITDWTLVGTTNENLDGALSILRLEVGEDADWLVDELRIGTEYGAVVSNLAPVPEPATLTLLLAGGLSTLRRRKRQ